MDIKFENLGKIDQLQKDLELIKKHIIEDTSTSKRWLSTKELSEYIPYTKETINKKVQDETFVCGVHFYQKERMRIFDKQRIDEWIINAELNNNKKALKESILKDFELDI